MNRIAVLSVSLAFAAVGTPSVASAQVYNDGHGREWRQLTTTTGLTWNQVASVCPTNGLAPCTGSVSGRDLTGWTWATREQVRTFFSYFESRILDQPTLTGSAYLLTALNFLGGGYINPTFSYYTTFGGYLYVSGWMADQYENGHGGLASASAQYPAFDAHWSIEAATDPATVPMFNGVWLWRALPGGPCPADFNNSGVADSQDFFDFVTAFFADDPAADFNADMGVNSQDFFDFVAAFFEGC